MVVGVLLAPLGVAACGSAPETIDPSGVDGLVVPTPAADPADFVDEVDNPLLPLKPGATWRHRGHSGGETVTSTTEVLAGSRDVQGVATTVVRQVVRVGDAESEVERYYAQDRAGNVWLFGVEVRTPLPAAARSDGAAAVPLLESWRAGEGGAEAGLAVPAEPRVGDGYLTGTRPDGSGERREVRSADAELMLEYGDLDGLLRTQVTSELEPGVVRQRYHAPGVGLVLDEVLVGGDASLELVAFDAGDA